MQFSNIWNLLREIKMSLTLAISRPRYHFVKFFLHIPPSYLEKSIDRRLFSDSVHVQAVGTKSERAGAEITTRGKLAIYLTCPLRQEVRANNFLEKISISENEKMIPPTP